MAETRKVIRIARKDVNSELVVERSLWAIKGVGKNYAHAVRIALGINNTQKIGELSEAEIAKIEDIIQHPTKYNFPAWMLNHRWERDTGENNHYVESNLDFRKKTDIDFMKKTRNYKGVRHQAGQPVRGQRTKSHFRGGSAIGVTKKKEVPGKAAAPAAAPAAKSAAKPAAKKK
jgi:small subunit ribosomal protein S13